MPGEDDAPSWTTYVTVDDVDRFANSGKGLGADVTVPPMSLGDAGRMAVISHPFAGSIASFEYAHPFS